MKIIVFNLLSSQLSFWTDTWSDSKLELRTTPAAAVLLPFIGLYFLAQLGTSIAKPFSTDIMEYETKLPHNSPSHRVSGKPDYYKCANMEEYEGELEDNDCVDLFRFICQKTG